MAHKVVMSGGAYLSLAAFLFVQSIALLLLYETWALARGHKPITLAVRAYASGNLAFVALVSLTVGLLLAHFFWNK